ncbi:MAG: CoA-binding protein [Pyrinomonadaceae bacterium]
MTSAPKSVSDFLSRKRIIVAGVSRSGSAPANAIFRRLRDTGHEVIPVNPNVSEVEGQQCYADVGSVPGQVDGTMVVTHPSISATIARAALERGVKHIWFHRSFGTGSVASEAIQLCRERGVEPIVGGCPLMYCQPVDPGHRFFRWWLRLRKRIPG